MAADPLYEAMVQHAEWLRRIILSQAREREQGGAETQEAAQ